MITAELVTEAIACARVEIEKYGLPTTLHFDLSLAKAEEIAKTLGADVRLTVIGTALMDLKLGEAFQQKRLPEHVDMSVATARDILARHSLTDEEVSRILNCIAAHHGTVPHTCLESEITTNADCYRFMHPVGVLSYIGTLSKRHPDLDSVVNAAEAKLDEKQLLLTLPICKSELEGHYAAFKAMFAEARHVHGYLKRSALA